MLEVVQLEAHAIVDLIVAQRDMVLVHRVPLLDLDAVGPCACLRCNHFLQVADRVVLVDLHAHSAAQTVVADHFNHMVC